MKFLPLIFLIICSCSNIDYADGINCPFDRLPIKIVTNDDAVLESIDIWNNLFHYELFVQSYYDGVEVSYVDGFDKNWFAVTYNSCDDEFKKKSSIEIKNGLSYNHKLAVISHELGHVLGLPHTDYGIMVRVVAPWNYNEIVDRVDLMYNDVVDLYQDYL